MNDRKGGIVTHETDKEYMYLPSFNCFSISLCSLSSLLQLLHLSCCLSGIELKGHIYHHLQEDQIDLPGKLTPIPAKQQL